MDPILATAEGPVSLNVGVLTSIFLAILLAISGLVQRSAAKKVDPEKISIKCPNKIEELWPRIQDLARHIEHHDDDAEPAIDEIHELLKLHKARDKDGVPRWYGRDQGERIIAQNEMILAILGSLSKELEIRNRLNGNGRPKT